LTAEIRKSSGPEKPGAEKAFHGGLKPSAAWTQRNPLTEILLPSLLTRREGRVERPEWPVVAAGEVAITWIGHASFLIQTSEGNVLVDPIWGNWLKGIKRMRHAGVEPGALPPVD
jgi:hypothetical protein